MKPDDPQAIRLTLEARQSRIEICAQLRPSKLSQAGSKLEGGSFAVGRGANNLRLHLSPFIHECHCGVRMPEYARWS